MIESVFVEIQSAISLLSKDKIPLLIAIDGNCAAGKTTFALQLKKEINCNVMHMDDFFLRSEQRTKKRLEEPGGNVDYERFLCEVLIPLKRGVAFLYRPYDCRSQRLGTPIFVKPTQITIIEGVYSCHPSLWDYYDLHIFLQISSKEQLNRLKIRNGIEEMKTFQNKWIPLEERYFKEFSIRQRCEFCFCTENG